MADAATFLDEQRPFRRGEIALARRAVGDPMFMHPDELEILRYAIRLAQISSLGAERDTLIDRIASFRLRMLQLLEPVLPTDSESIDARDLHALLPKVVRLVDEARGLIVRGELADEGTLAGTAHRDKPFWDLHVAFRRPPPLLLRALLAKLRPWRELRLAS